MISVAKDSTHEHRSDSTTVVSLCCEVDNRDNSTNKNVQAGSSDACCRSNVHRESDKVLDCTATVENNHDGEDGRSDHCSDHTMPPEESDGYERGA